MCYPYSSDMLTLAAYVRTNNGKVWDFALVFLVLEMVKRDKGIHLFTHKGSANEHYFKIKQPVTNISN